MTDTIKVDPTPIQRNDRDVAIELTKLYYERNDFENADEIVDIYLKFYLTAAGASNRYHYLTNRMPEDLQRAYER